MSYVFKADGINVKMWRVLDDDTTAFNGEKRGKKKKVTCVMIGLLKCIVMHRIP